MIRVNRSTDFKKETLWVTIDHNEETRRCKQLYCGLDVNGAVAAAVSAGLSREEAVNQATAALERSRNPVCDQIA